MTAARSFFAWPFLRVFSSEVGMATAVWDWEPPQISLGKSWSAHAAQAHASANATIFTVVEPGEGSKDLGGSVDSS